jgi:hypothetical protein
VSIEFLQAVLPPHGVYCAVAIDKNGQVRQSFHETIQDLVDQGKFISDSGRNAYFALSSFASSESRKAANAAYTRSFFLDLDCGPGKPYSDQAAAGVALREFITRMELPEPYVVNSGRGLHVYWPLEEPLPTAEWLGYAGQFKALCLNSDFAIDPAVPADAARVLRLPDTNNFKADPPLPVQIVATGSVIKLEDFLDKLPAKMNFDDVQRFEDFTSAVGKVNYPTSEFRRLVVRSVKGSGCGQIANAVQNAATLEEPLWRAALAVAWRCSDAEKAIHQISRDHPGYDFEDTVKKAEATKGPTTCKWYRDNYPEGCEGCEHKITSPILLGRKVEAAREVDGAYVVQQQLEPDNTDAALPAAVTVNIPAYPFPYFRGSSGGVFRRSKNKDGEPIEEEVYPYDLYLTSRYYDSDDHGDGEGELVQINLHTPHDGIRRFVTPVTTLMSKDKLRDALVKHGVITFGKHVDQLMAYFASSVKNLQRMFAADKTRNQMGWTSDGSGFVVGELEYTTAGIRLAPAASGTRKIAPLFTPKGDLEVWKEVVEFYNNPGMLPHQTAVLFGFASPLLRLFDSVDMRGALVNLMSNTSGTGKTTAQMVVNSIFGHPYELLLKKDDTLASRIHWMGMLNSITVTMDEITNIEDEDLSALAYEIPQGRGKHRMESQVNKMRMNSTTWCNFSMSSSNSSMYDKMMRSKATPAGEVRRIIEIPFSRPSGIDKAVTDKLFSLLAQNYGVAGPVFIQHVVANEDEVRALLLRVKAKVDAAMGMEQSDRFFSMGFASMLTAGIICNKLDLLKYDMKALFEYATGLVSGIQMDVVNQVSDLASISRDALAAYINDNINNVLVINGNANGVQPAPITMPRGALRMRYEPDSKRLWIPATEFKGYLANRQVSVREALAWLIKQQLLLNDGQTVVKRLSSGAIGSMDSTSVRCYVFNGEVIDEDVEVKAATATRA